MKNNMDLRNLAMWVVLPLWLFQTIFNALHRLFGSTRRFFFGSMPWEEDFATYRITGRIDTQASPCFEDFAPRYWQAKKTARGVIRELKRRNLRATYGVIFIDHWSDRKQEWQLKKVYQFLPRLA